MVANLPPFRLAAKCKGRRRGGGWPPTRCPQPPTRGIIVPATPCRAIPTLQAPLLSAAFALQQPSKPPLPALRTARLRRARCRGTGPSSAKRRAQMAAGPRSSVVRYPLVSCSHCWMTCRLHLTMSLTSRQDFARYKHPVWKRMHGISGKQLCGCRDTAQRARSGCQFLAARPHGVLHWHHHISTVCVDDQLICPPLQNFEKMFMNRVLLYSAFSFSVR